MQFIDLKAQYRVQKRAIDARIADVLEHGRYVMGPEVGELEARLAAFAGVEHAIAVSSGTDALLIALMALGIGPGDEVITTAFSFIAPAEMIAFVGATPVFVDIDPVSFNLDPDRIEKAVTSRTRAVLPVSLYGQCADFDRINAVAAAQGLPVIDDAAQSFGATYHGRRSCALTRIACTSFFPSKPLGCYGDAGACFTNDADLARSVRAIRDHGQDGRYHHVGPGLNGRMDTLQAAILLAKLDYFPDEIAARERVAHRYDEGLRVAGDRLELPRIAAGCDSVYAQYTVQTDDRDGVVERLGAAGVPTAVHYPEPLHFQPVFQSGARSAAAGSLPVAERAAQRVLSLPLHPYLDPEQQDRIVAETLRALA